MGVVYKAHDSFLDRVVAVKTYRQDVPITDDVKRRFEREVRTASKLVHPNVVLVFDGGLEGGVPYLAMEFIDGPTLAAELLRLGQLPIDRAVRILLEVAEGLSYAHGSGVVHRDLKPANILLAGGHAKIADFGVAKVMSAGSAATTTPVGTPSYMAPEQIEGKGVDVRSDVFALAILSYEVLTGSQPFRGDGWTEVLYQIMHVDPDPPTKIRPTLPPGLDRALLDALQKDPAKRTPDVKTLAANLRAAFETAPPATRAAPPSRAATPPIETHERFETTIDDGEEGDGTGEFDAFRDLAPKKKAESTPILPVLAVLVLLALLGVGVIAYHRMSGEKPAPPLEATPLPLPTRALPPTALPTSVPATAVPRPTARPTSPPPTAVPTEPPRPQPTEVRERPTPLPRPTLEPRPTAEPRPTLEPRPTPEVERPQPTVPVAPPPAAGENPSVDVISDPPGADIVVDGVVKGRTPSRVSDLPPGTYEFEIRKDGFNSYRKTTRLDPQADYQMKVTLPPMVNSLRVNSTPPGATVKLNGEVKGRTPITLSQLPSARYDVSAQLEGFPEQHLNVDLRDGQLQEVRFSFGAR